MTIIYSRKEILRMIDDRRLDPKDLPSRRLSPSQVVVEVKNMLHFDVLTLPPGYEHDELLGTILHFFTLPDYAIRVGLSQKDSRNRAVQSFLAFVGTHCQKYLKNKYNRSNNRSLPVHVFNDWLEYLKISDTPWMVYRKSIDMLKVLSKALEHRFGRISKWPAAQKDAWQALKANIPKQPLYIKNPPLGRYLGIPESQFTNHELQMGLRYGVIWLLQHLNDFRQAMLEESAITEVIRKLKGQSYDEVKQKFRHFQEHISNSSRRLENREFVRELAAPVWQCIQADPLLTEWQFYSWPKLRTVLIPNDAGLVDPFPKNQQQLLLERFVEADGCMRVRTKGFGRKDTEWKFLKLYLGSAGRGVNLRKPCFWGINWLVHTPLECLLMQWLLASERAQASGIERLTLDGVRVSGNGANLQISTIKLRRGSDPHTKRRHTDVESAIYKRRTPPYDVYKRWLELERYAQGHLNEYNPKSRFVNALINGQIVGNTVCSITNSYLPLELLSVQGTAWNDTFIEEAGNDAQREAKAFLAILQNRVALKRANPEKNVCLSVGPIGESLVLELEADSNNRAHDSELVAEVAGHTGATGRIYKDGYARLCVAEIIEPVRAFARKVGDGKVELAELLAQKLAASGRKVTFAELEKLCGIESSGVVQSALLSKLDEQEKLTIAGEILCGDETLVVETDMTAGMMWGYIQHLESQLPTLIASERSNTSIRYLAQLIHYHQVFKGFDQGLQQSGRQLAAELNFPFPSLI